MTAVPRCCAPADDRRDNTDPFGLASPRPVTAGPVGTGGTPPRASASVPGPARAALPVRRGGLWTPPLPWTRRPRPQGLGYAEFGAMRSRLMGSLSSNWRNEGYVS